jgi:hypothetical protein
MSTNMTFEDLLPRLVTAYDRGLLVPFLGAGMSRELCPSWTGLVEQLESVANIRPRPESAGEPTVPAESQTRPEAQPRQAPTVSTDVIQRANRAVRRLALRHPEQLAATLRDSLYTRRDDRTGEAPEQTSALARLWWPLVITTNYDDLFAREYSRRRREEDEKAIRAGGGSLQERGPSGREAYDGHIQVLGRSRHDGQRVLDSLSVTVPSILWAIHGFLPRSGAEGLDHLARELVVGHDEYRRLAHAETYYRRAFAEVWRRRSFLFLGSSLSDPYLLDLFSEVQELHGTNPQPHYALVASEQRVDVHFLRSRFNIVAVEHPKLTDLGGRLARLADAVGEARPRQSRWGWHLTRSGDARAAGTAGAPELEIVHSLLPTKLAENEAVAVSAGFYDAPEAADWMFFSPGIEESLGTLDREFVEAARSGGLHRLGEQQAWIAQGRGKTIAARIIALRPWRDRYMRDLRLIPALVETALDWALGLGATRLRMPLIGAGSSRHFPASVALSAIVREFARWRRERGATLSLTLHIVDPSAIFELTSGRLAVDELLHARDLRIWTEVQTDQGGTSLEGRLGREALILPDSTTLAQVAEELDLEGSSWSVSLQPNPSPGGARLALTEDGETVLRNLGVLPGTTLTFARCTADGREVQITNAEPVNGAATAR